jgi:hypothetical protein
MQTSATGKTFLGSSVTSGGARTACMTSVNKVVHRLISRIIAWLLKSYVHVGRFPHQQYILIKKYNNKQFRTNGNYAKPPHNSA